MVLGVSPSLPCFAGAVQRHMQTATGRGKIKALSQGVAQDVVQIPSSKKFIISANVYAPPGQTLGQALLSRIDHHSGSAKSAALLFAEVRSMHVVCTHEERVSVQDVVKLRRARLARVAEEEVLACPPLDTIPAVTAVLARLESVKQRKSRKLVR